MIYQTLAKSAYDLLKKYGAGCKIERKTSDATNEWNPKSGATTTTTFDIYAAIFDDSAKEETTALNKSLTKKVYLESVSGVVPALSDIFVDASGNKAEITNVRRVAPAEIDCFYVCKVSYQ